MEWYWSRHTVNSRPFKSAGESEAYLAWRFQQYPLFREFMDLWGDHDGQTILDYGCGPGDDVTGFLLHTGARRVIGLDVSPKALDLTHRRLQLHEIDPGRYDLIKVSDATPSIPLESASVDYINCGGVLHHTSDPVGILAEFSRVLRPKGEARVMVYNRESVWLHLYTAYVRMIVDGAFADLPIEEAFARNTDGDGCPVSRCYDTRQFGELAGSASFQCAYLGGYLSLTELDALDRFGARAVHDSRLGAVHREFVSALTRDPVGLPLFRDKHAGIGGVYHLRHP